MNNSCFVTMSNTELLEVNGGMAWWAIVLIAAGCCGCFALGVYNGFNDTASGK